MRREEAQCISGFVAELGLKPGSQCLNLGSSTRHFREVLQPHIAQYLIKPLEAAGIQFVHCDMKPADGVDLVGDVFDEAFMRSVSESTFDLLLACNILEHLVDPVAFSNSLKQLVRPGGFIVVSVPLSYPYHRDPIDTMLRLSPEQIAQFFEGFGIIKSDVVASGTFWDEIRGERDGFLSLMQEVGVLLTPFYKRYRWPGLNSRLFWLFRPYKTSVAVLQRVW